MILCKCLLKSGMLNHSHDIYDSPRQGLWRQVIEWVLKGDTWSLKGVLLRHKFESLPSSTSIAQMLTCISLSFLGGCSQSHCGTACISRFFKLIQVPWKSIRTWSKYWVFRRAVDASMCRTYNNRVELLLDTTVHLSWTIFKSPRPMLAMILDQFNLCNFARRSLRKRDDVKEASITLLRYTWWEIEGKTFTIIESLVLRKVTVYSHSSTFSPTFSHLYWGCFQYSQCSGSCSSGWAGNCSLVFYDDKAQDLWIEFKWQMDDLSLALQNKCTMEAFFWLLCILESEM